MIYGTQLAMLVVLLVLVFQRALNAQISKTRALLYLTRYGYVEPSSNSSSLLTENGLDEYLKSAIMDFQAFAGLNQTGVLDSVTEELMNTPRCGVKDKIGFGATARRKRRYILQGSRWQTNDLTYRVSKYPTYSSMTKYEVDSTIKKAFGLWEAVTNLRFSRKSSGSVHIEIRYEKYSHGDGFPFDGPGSTLAHAFFPKFGGDVHMDDSEYWTIDSFKGTNMLQTLVHEIGHSLGLDHSDVSSAQMAPFHQGYVPNLQLDRDDIRAIQALYRVPQAKPTARPTPRPPAPTFPPVDTPGDGESDKSLCGRASIDAIFTTKDGSTYVFKGSNYWKLTDTSVESGYPRKIEDDWSGLPSKIDAAFTWKISGATYFFKGNEYWKFENKSPNSGYPKEISRGFPDIPGDLDAAFVWGGNDKIYFMKGNQYWKFDPKKTPHVQIGKYPSDISMWGLPRDIDAALQWDNGKSYFFKDGVYWRYNDIRFKVDRGNPDFPRNAGEWWFGCPKYRPLTAAETVAILGEPTNSQEEEEDDEYVYDAKYFTGVVGDEDLDVYIYEDFD